MGGGQDERLPGLATELVRLKVDVIVTHRRQRQAAKAATTTIPIVMAAARTRSSSAGRGPGATGRKRDGRGQPPWPSCGETAPVAQGSRAQGLSVAVLYDPSDPVEPLTQAMQAGG